MLDAKAVANGTLTRFEAQSHQNYCVDNWHLR